MVSKTYFACFVANVAHDCNHHIWLIPNICFMLKCIRRMTTYRSKSTQNSEVNSLGFSPTPYSYFDTMSFPSTVKTESSSEYYCTEMTEKSRICFIKTFIDSVNLFLEIWTCKTQQGRIFQLNGYLC